MRTRTFTTRSAPVVILTSSLLLAACGSGDADTPDHEGAQADAVIVTDAWVKAADEGMTSAFGLIENSRELPEGEERSEEGEVTVVAVETDDSFETELHATTEDSSGGMSMEEQEGGFPIQPQETRVLEPGAEHIMFMELSRPLEHGTTTEFTLVFADESTLEVAADVRSYSGAQENYGGMEDDAHGEHGE